MTALPFDLDELDDIGFVHLAQAIATGVVDLAAPAACYLIKLDGWFGPRWLGFSHKALGAVRCAPQTLRVPPFVPARVRSQHYLRRSPSGDFLDASAPPIHVTQTSADNAHRLMSAICPDAAAIWWSGATRTTRRGSLMVYVPTSDGHTGWYAELAHTTHWRPVNTLNTSAPQLTAYATARAAG